jgi:ABC-type uncharacterized transport system auxiliary subunit
MTALVSLSVGLMRDSRTILVIGLLIVLASLAGCAGKIRYPNYYVLNIPAPEVQVQPKPILGSVAVREFSAPRYLRGGSIAYRQSPEQLDFYNYDRWADDPRDVVTVAMVREMEASGLFKSIDVFDGRETPGCLVTGTIDHLEEVGQNSNLSIEVRLSARLISLRTGEVLWQDTSSKTTNVDQPSVQGIVAEMSRDVGDAVEHLVSSMQGRLSAGALSGPRLDGRAIGIEYLKES